MSSPLLAAVLAADVASLRALLDAGADADEVVTHGFWTGPLLGLASHLGRTECVRLRATQSALRVHYAHAVHLHVYHSTYLCTSVHRVWRRSASSSLRARRPTPPTSTAAPLSCGRAA